MQESPSLFCPGRYASVFQGNIHRIEAISVHVGEADQTTIHQWSRSADLDFVSSSQAGTTTARKFDPLVSLEVCETVGSPAKMVQDVTQGLGQAMSNRGSQNARGVRKVMD
jgi:hypothetical protein